MPPGAPKRLHARTVDKIHIICRLELSNPLLSTTDLAKLVGLSPQSYNRIKRLPLYLNIHNQYLNGVLTRLDTNVDSQLSLAQETLQFAVPVAMQNLLKQALQDKDLRIQNKASNDILDRQGMFAKVTRIGLPTKEQGNIAESKDASVAQELINAMANNHKTVINDIKNGISDPPVTKTIQ